MIKPRQRTLSLLLSAYWLCAAQVAPAFADELLWKTLFESGQEAARQNRLSEAEKQLSAALKQAGDFGEKDKRLYETVRLLAAVLEEQGRYVEAIDAYERAIVCAEAAYGAESGKVVTELTSLAMCFKNSGNHEKATSNYLKALGIMEKKFPQSPSLAAGYHNLAVVFQDMGKWAEAESLFKKALGQYEKTVGPDDERTLLILRSLAGCYCRQCRYLEAEALLKRGVTSLLAAEKPDNPEKRSWIIALADVYFSQGKVKEANELYLKAVTAARAAGESADDYADVLEAAGKFYTRQGRAREALECLDEALALREKGGARNNPQLADTLIAVGEARAELAQYREAEIDLKRATKLSCGGCSIAKALTALGRIYTLQGKYSEARAAYEKANSLIEDSLGQDDLDFASGLTSLAWLSTNERKWKEAIPLLARALSIREKAFGQKHAMVGQSLLNLADAVANGGDTARAETLTKKALEIFDEMLGCSNDSTLLALRQLAELKQHGNNLEGAEETYRELIDREEKIEPKDVSVLASDLTALAEILAAQNRPAQARKCTADAEELMRKLSLPPRAVAISPAARSVENESVAQEGSATHRPIKDKWAVVIGVSNFKDPSINLKFAAKDAVDFKNYLVSEANFKPDHVKLLVDSQATRENIVSVLGEGWLRRLANKDDLVLVYISSHGSAPKQEAADHNFIVPYEGNLENIMLTGIPMQWLTAGLKELVHCDRIALMLDVCHGGAVYQGSRGMKRENMFSINSLTPGTGQLVLASSDSDQLSWESKRYDNGVFTRRLMDALRENGGNVNLKDAFSRLKESVEEEVLRDRALLQTPVLVHSTWTGNDLVISTKPVAPRPGLEASGEGVASKPK